MDEKPYFRYCHIPSLNGDSSDPHFSFTPYDHFTAETAHKVCNEIGGKLPGVGKEYDALWLAKSVSYLSSFVRYAWPYSLRWSSWPVSSGIKDTKS